MTVRLLGSTSGYAEIDAPAVAGNNTLVLPTTNGAADQALVTNGSGTLSFADRGRMVLETAKTATGTSIDFTGIPSWVKRVTVMFNAVSTNGATSVIVQAGTSAGVVTTNYNFCYGALTSPSTPNAGALGTGIITAGTTSSRTIIGSASFMLLSGNTWSLQAVTADTSVQTTVYGTGLLILSGTLDRIRITTVNGTDTFDTGSINILMEG